MICQICFAQEQSKDLLDALTTGDKEMQKGMVNDLKQYNKWWNSLSNRQKQMASFIDEIEERFKINNNGIPITKTEQNIRIMSRKIGARNLSEVAFVGTRMQQHLNDYNETQTLEKMNDAYNDLIKKLPQK